MRASTTLLAVTLTLASCAAPDSHTPAFIQHNYAPFSRTAAIAIATDEWRLWGMRIDDNWSANYTQTESTMAERQPGLWQRVGEYWWEGMNANQPAAAWTGKHDARGKIFPVPENGQYAWSAAFISYVMRIAGAGENFPYSPDHAHYINYAARAAQGKIANALLIAENPATYAPRPGDLICFARAQARTLTFADLPTPHGFPAHCSIVVAGKPNQISVIGGNVDDSVTLQHVPASNAGQIGPPWFVVIKVLYRTNS